MSEFGSRIENAYQLLGHRLGWRFLYTPASTLSPSARLALVGLNPGGSEYEKPILSVEAGSAYRVESWGADDTLNPLQVQVARLYAEISAYLTAGPGPIRLMDETLTANLCPFRAPAWDQLANPAASVLSRHDCGRTFCRWRTRAQCSAWATRWNDISGRSCNPVGHG